MTRVLFLHTNFPAQFGQIAESLARRYGYQCSFASERAIADTANVKHVQFTAAGGAMAQTHFASRNFENQIWRSHAVYEALQKRTDIVPDVIVAHSGFVSPIFLRELYPDAKHIGYFEYFYHRHHSDIDFRSDLPSATAEDKLKLRIRNAQILLDLENCDAGYSPTNFQRSQLPPVYQPKIRTIFDGIETSFWSRKENCDRKINDLVVPSDHQIVTYVSRGFEAMRGFDQFIQVADAVCKVRQNVTFVVAGEDRVAYGGDLRYTDGKTFKEWVLEKYNPDLSRIHFVGRLTPTELVKLFSISSLHLYWTAPFVLSWSLINALSCECKIIASDTAPVKEVIADGFNGFLCDFFDISSWVSKSLFVLDNPSRCAPFGKNGRRCVLENYQLDQAVESVHALLRSVLR